MTDLSPGELLITKICLRRLASVELNCTIKMDESSGIEDWQRGAEEAIAKAAAVEAVRLVFDKI